MVTLKINGKAHTVDAPPDMPLLWALRDLLGIARPPGPLRVKGVIRTICDEPRKGLRSSRIASQSWDLTRFIRLRRFFRKHPVALERPRREA